MAVDLTVHGREALYVPISEDGEDLTDRVLYFETQAIRKALVPDPTNPLRVIIYLTREEVDTLPSKPVPYAIIDESDPDIPRDILDGTIQRVGFKKDE